MRYRLALLMALAFSALTCFSASAAVFQYTVPTTILEKPAAATQPASAKPVAPKPPSTAFLWIPAQAKQVRGVIISGMTLMEREFSRDPVIRAACEDQQLAIVFMKSGLGSVDIQKVLDDLANVSGYREISVAPLMFVGHSAGGPQAHDCAVQWASRCFGLVQYRGGGPWNGEPITPGIPTLMMVGEFDEFGGMMRNEAGREQWERSRDTMIEFRGKDPGNLSSIIIEPGAGHFAWSNRNAVYLAMFIRKAAQGRIPASWPIDAAAPVALQQIDYHTGWLTDLTINAPSKFAPAPVDQYAGDKASTNWHFDKEMAEATVAYHAGGFGKKDQFIKWTDSFYVDAGARFFFNSIKWVGDGQTFEVHPVYADAYPKPQPSGGPRWFAAGQPVEHSTAPILVKTVSGPIVPVGPNTLRMKYDSLAPATEASRVTFMAYSLGDAQFRHTEQVGMMPRGFAGLKGGTPQTITFPQLPNLKADSAPVDLKATSDSGLPVEYYVAVGPATIEDGKLKITEVPARATFPITVKVVALQFGSGVSPQFQTATPVDQVIQIQK